MSGNPSNDVCSSIQIEWRPLIFLKGFLFFFSLCGSVLGFMVFNSLVYEVTIPLLLLSEDKQKSIFLELN
jgi:hypothetical protein